MTNLKLLFRLPKSQLPLSFPYSLPKEVLDNRKHVVLDAISRFYSSQEIDQVLSNRRSDFSDDAVISDFLAIEQPEHTIPTDANFLEAISVTTEKFRPSIELYPIAFPDLRYYPWNLVPSAEAPWNLPDFKFSPFIGEYDWKDPNWMLFKHKQGRPFRVREWLRYKQSIGVIKNDTPNFHNLYNELFVYNRTLIHQIKYGMSTFWTKEGKPKPYYWNTLHSRSHVVSKDEPDKIRAVFGCPKLLLMAENMFIWQLQRVYLNNEEGCMLWGREMMKGGWRKLWNEIHSNGMPHTILSIDWSKWDKRFLHQLIRIVHQIWRTYFSFDKYAPTSYYPNAKPESSEHIERLWSWMCESIISNPILLPDGRVYTWTRNGFGSGFQQTQLMDSFANMIVILTCLKAMGINIRAATFWIRIQGDDSLTSFFERVFDIYGPSFLERLAECAQYYFNAKLSTKKSTYSNNLNDISVLSYFNRYGMPYRTDEDLLRHLMFPEHDQDWTRLAASAMGLAMASTGCSLRFYNTCHYIWNELVVKRGVKPYFRTLKWMERANMIERIESLSSAEFPKLLEMRSEVWTEPKRTESAKQRLWPTKADSAGGFFFL
ncbi:hypothetical protein [Lichen partiti-like RNA virus 1]|nr:hypothetical protein [Lichen partiti-like RNA virus 1]